MIGYKHTEDFIRKLNEIDLSGFSSVIEMYDKIVNEISSLEFIREEVTEFQKNWIKDISNIL
jgi:hypothetical protein